MQIWTRCYINLTPILPLFLLVLWRPSRVPTSLILSQGLRSRGPQLPLLPGSPASGLCNLKICLTCIFSISPSYHFDFSNLLLFRIPYSISIFRASHMMLVNKSDAKPCQVFLAQCLLSGYFIPTSPLWSPSHPPLHFCNHLLIGLLCPSLLSILSSFPWLVSKIWFHHPEN